MFLSLGIELPVLQFGSLIAQKNVESGDRNYPHHTTGPKLIKLGPAENR